MRRFLKNFLNGADTQTRRKIIAIYLILGSANIAVWGLAVLVFYDHPLLLGTSALAYSFGLRHAVDADHIAAIDNVTRKLMQQGQRPVAVGFYFSLGHSTIVFALSAATAVSALALKDRFEMLASWGNIIGTIISAAFLIAIAVVNIIILRSIIKTFRHVKAGGTYDDESLNGILTKRGFFGYVFRGLFKMVTRPIHMYLIGFLFGLGFDTATEVGLLGIAAASASKGLPIWSIMVFPALFMVGMALVDTTDSVMMFGVYGWAFMKPMRKLFYNITITSVSVLVAVLIGSLETLGLIQGTYNLGGWFWGSIATISGDTAFGLLGFVIIGIFAGAWLISVAVYRLKRYDDLQVTLTD